jgi:hypothetical protein
MIGMDKIAFAGGGGHVSGMNLIVGYSVAGEHGFCV